MSSPPTQPAAAAALGLDAYKPAEIAERIEIAGVAKARLRAPQMLALAFLGGVFIAFGAMAFTVVTTEHGLGWGPARLLGGVAFSLGLILVVIAGAELFTGNALIVMAWIDGRVSLAELARNWSLVFLGNLAGSVAAALGMAASGLLDGPSGATAAAIASAKVELPAGEALTRGVLCNALVCLAIWLSFAAREVAGKILAIVPPIAAFVAIGFEHSIANLYFLSLALAIGADGVGLGGAAHNVFFVTIGNILGGGVGVGLSYWLCYKMR